MRRMRSHVKTGILLAAAALAALLVSGVLYSNYARKHGFVGVTEDTPAFNVRVLLTAVLAYEAKYNSLPPNLSSLGPPSSEKQASGEAANVIDSRLALGSKNGYVYHYVPNGPSETFIITADPTGDGSPALQPPTIISPTRPESCESNQGIQRQLQVSNTKGSNQKTDSGQGPD